MHRIHLYLKLLEKSAQINSWNAAIDDFERNKLLQMSRTSFCQTNNKIFIMLNAAILKSKNHRTNWNYTRIGSARTYWKKKSSQGNVQLLLRTKADSLGTSPLGHRKWGHICICWLPTTLRSSMFFCFILLGVFLVNFH